MLFAEVISHPVVHSMTHSLDCVEASPDLSIPNSTMAITQVFVGDNPMRTVSKAPTVQMRCWEDLCSYLSSCVSSELLDPVPWVQDRVCAPLCFSDPFKQKSVSWLLPLHSSTMEVHLPYAEVSDPPPVESP